MRRDTEKIREMRTGGGESYEHQFNSHSPRDHEDAETLVNLGGETWIHTYIADRYTPGMHSYVNNIFHPQLLKAQLAESARSFFLIAE
jgi:hypothetical protein